MAELQFYAKAFIAVLVLVNPLEGVPVFLSATAQVDPAVRAAIVRRAPLALTIVLITSLLLGNALLRLFGISIGAFQVGGGLLLFWIAFQMAFGIGGPSLGGAAAGGVDASFAVVPLAIPLMAGPGSISGAILYGTRAHSIEEMALLTAVMVLVGLATWASLIVATPMVRVLKASGIDIATRIMGLIIAAIAVEMIAHGVGSLFGLTVAV
jgi:multiple antibiotic resistance protein